METAGPRRADPRGFPLGVEVVAAGKARRRFTIRFSAAQEAMPASEWEAVEQLMAELVARAYYSELLRRTVAPSENTQDSGPSPAAAAVEDPAQRARLEVGE